MKPKDDKFSLRRGFVGLFVGAQTGWGTGNQRRLRDNHLQSDFRADLKLEMGSEHPNPDMEVLWCPITSCYWSETGITAGHLFPWKCGQDNMDAIFGRPDDKGSELFKVEMGILWSTESEKRFQAGHFVIVPDIPDQANQQLIEKWELSNPKEYKIRVLNPDHEKMTKKILDTQKRWADLDDQRVHFRTNFRPRARYLYFCYCEAMLRRSFACQHLNVSRAELRKRFWGTPGRYMREGMLLGFVEELGHEYHHLLEDVTEEKEAIPDKTAVLVADTHFQEAMKAEDWMDGDEDEDEDEDEEDEFIVDKTIEYDYKQ